MRRPRPTRSPAPWSPRRARPATWSGWRPPSTGGGLAAIVTRSRWLALEALHVLWPRCPLQALAEKLGGSGAGSWGSLNTAKSSRWWSDHAVNRIVDAI